MMIVCLTSAPYMTVTHYTFATIVDGAGMFMYYAKIVPTSYHYRNGIPLQPFLTICLSFVACSIIGGTLQTNQFSVTEHFRKVPAGQGQGLPGMTLSSILHIVMPLMMTYAWVYVMGYK
jgi:hypothetical protein